MWVYSSVSVVAMTPVSIASVVATTFASILSIPVIPWYAPIPSICYFFLSVQLFAVEVWLSSQFMRLCFSGLLPILQTFHVCPLLAHIEHILIPIFFGHSCAIWMSSLQQHRNCSTFSLLASSTLGNNLFMLSLTPSL